MTQGLGSHWASLTSHQATKPPSHPATQPPSSQTQGQSVGSGKKAGQTFSSKCGRAPWYRLSPNYFQKFKRIPAPDWAQKMLCIIVPNRQTVSPEFFSWVCTWRLLSHHTCPVRSPSLCVQGKLLFSTFLTRNKGITDELRKRLGYYQQEQLNLPREYSVFDGSQLRCGGDAATKQQLYTRASPFFVHFFAVNCTTTRENA